MKIYQKLYDTDVGYSFFNSKVAIFSFLLFLIIAFCSLFAEFVSPYNPFDPLNISLMDAFIPPIWSEGGDVRFILGTDQQGRDMLSTIIYGSRISLIVGFASIIFAMVLGVFLGVTAGYLGGKYEIIVMRLTDVQLTIPSILMALLVDGIARAIISKSMHDEMAIYVLIFAIGISEWPQFARVTRASTLVEKNPVHSILYADNFSIYEFTWSCNPTKLPAICNISLTVLIFLPKCINRVLWPSVKGSSVLPFLFHFDQ